MNPKALELTEIILELEKLDLPRLEQKVVDHCIGKLKLVTLSLAGVGEIHEVGKSEKGSS